MRTTTVIGRLRAARTKRIFHLSKSLTRLGNERLNVSRSSSDAEQRPPDAETGQRIIDLGLGQQALSFRDLIDVAKSRLIASCRLLGRGARGGDLDRRIRGHASRAGERATSAAFHWAFKLVAICMVLGCLRPDVGRLPSFLCPDRKLDPSPERSR